MSLTRRETMAMLAATGVTGAVGDAAAVAMRRPASPMLWYRQPAAVWTEALPIGNGVLGAIVFGGIGHERIQLNEATLWAGGPYNPVNEAAKTALPKVRELVFTDRIAEAEALTNQALIGTPPKQMPYQILGDLLLDFPGTSEASAYRRELDLDAAMATTRFTIDGVEHLRQVIASPTDKVIAVRLTADPGKLGVDIALTSPQPGAATNADGDAGLLLTGTNEAAQGVPGALRFAARLLAVCDGGQVVVADGKLLVRGANAVTLLVAMATSFRRFDDVTGDPLALTATAIARARSRPFARIAADASAAHRRLFRRVSIDLGSSAAATAPTDERINASQTADDPALAALYFNYGRYLLISCSRPGGTPATLQGLWNDSLRPPWESKYTININTEMNYWSAQATNLAECVEPLTRFVRDLAITGERTAREMYGARGWVAHHNTDIWHATASIEILRPQACGRLVGHGYVPTFGSNTTTLETFPTCDRCIRCWLAPRASSSTRCRQIRATDVLLLIHRLAPRTSTAMAEHYAPDRRWTWRSCVTSSSRQVLLRFCLEPTQPWWRRCAQPERDWPPTRSENKGSYRNGRRTGTPTRPSNITVTFRICTDCIPRTRSAKPAHPTSRPGTPQP